MTLPEWENVARRNFESGACENSLITYRGLYPNAALGIEGYIDILPEIEGQSLDNWLIRKNASEPGYRICDVGFGKGIFLLSSLNKFPNLNYIAYGNLNAAAHPTVMLNGSLFPSTLDLLKSKEINIVEGDLLDINRKLPEKSVDLIVMSNVLGHLRAPRSEIFSRMVKILSGKGQILISDARRLFWEPDTDGNFNDTRFKLRNIGYDLKMGIIYFTRPKDFETLTTYTVNIFPLTNSYYQITG